MPTRDVEVVDRRQHFADKLHALTRTYGDRPNSRVRDLPDLVLLIEDRLEADGDLVARVRHVFDVRGTHPVPERIPDPPSDWAERYAALASELDSRCGSNHTRSASRSHSTAATRATAPPSSGRRRPRS